MESPLEFEHRPSVVAYQLRAFAPSPGLTEARGFPELRARWRRARVPSAAVAEFLATTGLRTDQPWDLVFPHVFGFPLHMVILTHPAFPLPIWRALQIRNHFVQRRPLPIDTEIEMETGVAAQRVLDKGAEVDLRTTVRSRDELHWESLITFYYRGRFGTPTPPSPLAKAPEVAGEVVAEWDAASRGGRQFAALTGDYNPVHYWGWYARRFGFDGAFLHPQHVLGQCLARLTAPPAGEVQQLDAWLRGPVYRGSHVSLRAAATLGGVTFAVHTDRDARPATVGRWSAVRSHVESPS